MSTRWYPMYQKGGPQLRVYLPNFWMKAVKPTEEQLPNVVQFSCSMQMTKHDIKNYLEKIYNVKSVLIGTRVACGETKRTVAGYVTKADDIKYAYVTLPRNEKFDFPDIFPEMDKTKEERDKALAEAKDGFEKYLEKNKNRPNMPGWFTV